MRRPRHFSATEAHPLSPLGMPQEIALSPWHRASVWQRLGQGLWWACGLGLAGLAITTLTLTLTTPSTPDLYRQQAAQSPPTEDTVKSTASLKKAHLLVSGALQSRAE